MARLVTDEEKAYAAELLVRARAAMKEIEDYDQTNVDRLCQALAWGVGNEKTFTRLAQMGVDESGIGDREGRPAKRFKIQGILRDVLRQRSIGIIEEIPEKAVAFAIEIAQKCRWDDVGVDICLYNGNYYVLEANMKYGREGFRTAGFDYIKLMESMIANGQI